MCNKFSYRVQRHAWLNDFAAHPVEHVSLTAQIEMRQDASRAAAVEWKARLRDTGGRQHALPLTQTREETRELRKPACITNACQEVQSLGIVRNVCTFARPCRLSKQPVARQMRIKSSG